MRLFRDDIGHRPLAILLLTIVAGPMTGCRVEKPPVRTFAAASSSAPTKWEQLFTDEREVHLQAPAEGPPVLRIGRVELGQAGTMFIADHARILVFGPDGTLRRELPSGRDLPLIIPGAIALDPKGNLYIYDAMGDWITELSPAFRVVRRFQLQRSVAVNDIAPLRDGTLVTYDPADENGAFTRFDNNGHVISAVFPMPDARLRIFHGRVRGGGMTRDSAGDMFGILPSTFELVHLSGDGRVRELLRRSPGSASAPDSPPFPVKLDPYDFRPAHAAWWDTFTHIGQPFAVAPGTLVVTVFTSHGLGQAHEFADVYSTDGHIIAEGLRVPHDGHIVGAASGRIFIARNARLVTSDSVSGMALYSYKLHDVGGASAIRLPAL